MKYLNKYVVLLKEQRLTPRLRRGVPSLTILIISLIGIGCKKIVSVGSPYTSLTGENVFSSNSTAAAVMTGIYTGLSASSFATGENSISVLSGLSADEFSLLSGVTNTDLFYYTNSLTGKDEGSAPWSNIYQVLYVANSAIEGLNGNSLISPAVRQQLLGEALFVRAFCYFYLVNLYGEVALVTTTNYSINVILPNASLSALWGQIVMDLKDAASLLSSNYLDGTVLNMTNERVRPTKWAANALLSRVYLYMADYADSKAESDTVIDNVSLFALDSLNGVFEANSNEAIWQLQPVTTGITNTQDAYVFDLAPNGPNVYAQPVYLSSYLLTAFEKGDERRMKWVDSVIVNGDTFYFPYKYKVVAQNAPVSEYSMVLRLGEQYLNRAEAEANGAGSGLSAAIEDLDTIRTRAGLPMYLGGEDKTSVLNAIYHERQVELFSEWGHRWLDLKRTGFVNSIMGSPGNVCKGKGGAWNNDWVLYPIPTGDIQSDPNLHQNSGYGN